MSEYQLIYPTLDLFLYDLREGLGQSSQRSDRNRQNFWQKIYPNLTDAQLAEFAKAEKPEADFLFLLGSQKFKPFESSYDGHYFPVQLGDTYALQVDCSGQYADATEKTPNYQKQSAKKSVAELKQIILSHVNQKQGTLGQTWLLWAQLAADNQDAEKTAKECYTQLVGDSWKQDIQSKGKFLGAEVFELWRFPAEWTAEWDKFSQENQHVLIFLFPSNDDIETIRRKMPKIYFDLMRLFGYRQKIVWAYWQSCRLKAKLKSKYRSIRKFNNRIVKQLKGRRPSLNQLQDDLSKALKAFSNYTEDLNKLDSQLRAIKVNFANYQKRQKNFTNPLDKTQPIEFIIESGEGLFNPTKYQEQIESDYANLSPGLKLLENLVRNIEGIIEIEQTRSDRTLTYTVGVASIGLALSGVTATLISANQPKKYNDISISFLVSPAFVWSLGPSLIIIAIAIFWRKIRSK